MYVDVPRNKATDHEILKAVANDKEIRVLISNEMKTEEVLTYLYTYKLVTRNFAEQLKVRNRKIQILHICTISVMIGSKQVQSI